MKRLIKIFSFLIIVLTCSILVNNNSYAATTTECVKIVYKSKAQTTTGVEIDRESHTADTHWICVQGVNDPEKSFSSEAKFVITPSGSNILDPFVHFDNNNGELGITIGATHETHGQSGDKSDGVRRVYKITGDGNFTLAADNAGAGYKPDAKTATWGNFVESIKELFYGRMYEFSVIQDDPKTGVGTYSEVFTIDSIEDMNNGTTTDSPYDENGVPINPVESANDGNGNDNPENACYESGIDSMGWLVCPTINNISNASDGIMDLITEWLSVKPGQTFNDGIRAGWGIFRNISNIIVIIMLVVIIFSQITGVGIDNYGIKKTLPRLIIVAILINFSFIICEIAVDLSNILGQGLFSLFRNIADSIPGSSPGQNNLVPLVITSAVLAILGLIATGVVAGVAGIISLLLSLLLGIVSILFFFIMLAARSMAVIVLVIISPIALACYMLPNMQNYFNKWCKIFQACLIIYPICGALYGASYIIANIASNGENWFWSIIGLCAPFLPFLALPALVKNAIAGLGLVGSALTTISSTAKGAARSGVGTIKKSDTYKSFQHRHKAGVDRDGHQTAWGARRSRLAQTRAGRFLGMNSLMQANMGQAAKDRQTARAGDVAMLNARARREIAESGLSPQQYYEEQFDNAARRGDTDAMSTALDAAVESGYFRPGQLANMIRNAQNGEGNGINIEDEGERAEWMRDTAAKYGESFLTKDNELRTWMQNGGETTYITDSNGNRREINLGQHGEYAASHRREADPNHPGQTRISQNQTIGVDDIKKEDIPKLSANSLAGLIAAGSISQGTARQAIAENPNMDTSSRILLGAYANGAINQGEINNLRNQIDNNRNNDQYQGPRSVAQALVEDANAHARGNHNPNAQNGPRHRLINATHDQVDQWTRPAPQRVSVVHNP